MGRSEVLTSVVKYNEGLSNRVPIIIRSCIKSYEVCSLYGCIVHHILSYSSGFILCHCICSCMYCMLLFNCVNYVFLLLCLFRSGYSVSLCCSVYCLCINVYCTTATGCQPYCS
jgi:hypothetical protein